MIKKSLTWMLITPVVVLFLTACSSVTEKRVEPLTSAMKPPEIPREFRGVWIATVANIDWPSKPGLPVEQQKSELVAILDKCREMNLNAVVFQVRPQCDALYDSDIEPWSYYLTGKMGKAPEPVYDPLKFAVGEAHKRGLELHAWFNPYRANHPSNKSALPHNHVSKTNPGIVRQYGRYLWLDPTSDATKDYTMSVILEVVNKYDVDGVHIDDYFYPYQIRDDEGKIVDFPDQENWKKYRKRGGRLGRSDWRRMHVDKFVERFYREVKQAKPWVKVGISPFGIWRPGHPAGIKGLDQYEALFADARKWLRSGWVDYFTPQLYWPIDSEGQPYDHLLRWWLNENVMNRHIWPGNFTSRVGDQWESSEILNQVRVTRELGAGGNVHFSMAAFLENRGNLPEKLKNNFYSSQVLVPASPWLQKAPFEQAPEVKAGFKEDGDLYVNFDIDHREKVGSWVVSFFTNGKWSYVILPGAAKSYTLSHQKLPVSLEAVVVNAVDRCGVKSPGAVVRLD